MNSSTHQVLRPAEANPRNPLNTGSVLVVGPGSLGRGGIATVIQRHQETETWRRRGLRLLPTFDDRSPLHKIWSALLAYATAPLLLCRAQMVHVHLAAQTSIFRKLPIVAMARLLRRPVIVHVHAPSEENLFTKTPLWARRFVFDSAARVVALSESWAGIFRAHEPLSRVVVIANPVRDFAANAPAQGTTRAILFVGKLDARKGYADLLEAAAEVLQEFPEAEFWFAGHGEVQAAQALAARLEIAGRVRMLGWLEGPAMDAVYAAATVFALPSYAEGVPMSVLEAMSHGVPVICTPVGGLPELIDNGRNGVFVDPGDTRSLAREIACLLRHPEEAAALGAAGRHTVQRTCSIQRISSALETLYAEVAAEHARTRTAKRDKDIARPSASVRTGGTQ